MVDAILLGILAVLDLGFLLVLRVRRRKTLARGRIRESLNVFIRTENGYKSPKRRRLIPQKNC